MYINVMHNLVAWAGKGIAFKDYTWSWSVIYISVIKATNC